MSDRVIDPTRQGAETHEPDLTRVPDAPPLTVKQAVVVVDSWLASEDMPKYGLHQVAIALRAALNVERALRAEVEADWIVARKEREHYRARAHELAVAEGKALDERDLWEKAHDDAIAAWVTDVRRLSEEIGIETERWTDRIWCACQAIPCARGTPDGVGLDCACPDYPYAPCCNLRVALWPGDPFPTDYLPVEGWIHLFEPADPACPNTPRRSAGCVKIIEPT